MTIFPAQISGQSGSGEIFYPVGAAGFNGTTTQLTNASFTMNTSSGIFSCWILPLAATTTGLNLTDGTNTSLDFSYLFALTFGMRVYQGTASFYDECDTGFGSGTGAKLTSGVWNHVLFSWSRGTAFQVALNGIYQNFAPTLNHAATARGVIVKAAVGDPTTFSTQNYAEVYLSSGTYIDLSILANIRKFITASKRPAFLGSNGSLPTGSQPLVYFKGSGTGFNVNSGSGGNFTTAGTLTTPTTTPSNP